MRLKKIILILICILFYNVNYSATISGTYTAGDIPTNTVGFTGCNGPLTTLSISLPAGGPYDIISIDVSYSMTAAGGAWMSEQRSQIYCQNTLLDEGGYSNGAGNSSATQSYTRNGLTIANGNYPGGTAIVFEMQAYRTWGTVGCLSDQNKVDDGTWTITITYSASTPMSYTSSSVLQTNFSNIPTCASDQEIIGVNVIMAGSTTPLDLTQLRIRTNGSSNPLNDISNIDVYYTGNSSTFSTATLFGNSVPAATGVNIPVNGSQTLDDGDNYFWIAYDIAGTATIGNVLDAICNQITINGSNYTPTITTVAGNRTISVCSGTPGGTSQNTDIWLRSGSGTTPSTGTGTLTSWTNSGTNGAITINGAPDFDETGYNFNPKLHFNGNGNYLNNTAVTFGSIYGVVQMEDLTRTYTHLSTYQDMCLGTHADGSLHGGINGASSGFELTSYAPEFEGAGVWGHDGNYVGSTNIYSGNHQIINAVANSGDFDAYGDRLLGGQPCHPERDWLGDVSEVIVLTGVSTTNERDQIESYLAIKYGLTLGVNGTSKDYHSTDHSVIWDQSANTGYNFDITGIRRDDATELDQRKSHTEMWTAGVRNDIVTISNGNTFVTPIFIATDKSSLVWGHNNGPTINTGVIVNYPTDNGEVIQTIFQREWKSQESGTIGTVILEFDLSSVLGIDGIIGDNDLANLRLLIDEDGDYSDGFATSLSPISFDNTTNIVYFQHDFVPSSGTESDQNNGFFFTLGSTDFTTTILPIELSQFTVTCLPTQIKIEWETLSEVNSDYFEIEKSNDGINFMKIGTINASQNSSELKTYTWNDNIERELSYYRLKQVDLNGKISYSEIISSNCTREENFKIYPNPFNNQININIETTISPFEVCIKDDLGRVIFKQTIENNSNHFTIELDDSIESGIYYIVLHNSSFYLMEKIIKL